MGIWSSLVILAGALLLGFAPASASPLDRLPPSFSGGRFLSIRDSLGLEEFRQLRADQQKSRRKEATVALRAAREGKSPRSPLDLIATAAGLCPYMPQAWEAYAKGLHQIGFYESALLSFSMLERTLPYEPDEEKRLGLSAQLHGGRAAILHTLDRPQEALAHIEQAAELEPAELEWRLLRALVLGELGEFRAAQTLVRRALSRSSGQARAFGVQGSLFLAEGKLKRSEASFKAAHEQGLRTAVFHNDWGRMLLADERPREAAAQFESALALQPNFLEARNNLAVAWRRAGESAHARVALGQIIEMHPGYGAAHFNLAELRREELGAAPDSNVVREVLAHYDDALALGYRPELTIDRRATLLVSHSHLAGAESELLELAGNDEVDGRVLFLLGHVKKAQGDFEIATRLFEMAAAKGYDGADLHAAAGEIALRRGLSKDAERHLRAALARDPRLLVTRANLVLVLMQRGALSLAREVLEPGLAQAPQHPLLLERLRALDAAGSGP